MPDNFLNGQQFVDLAEGEGDTMSMQCHPYVLEDEQNKVYELIGKGYTVEIVNLKAEKFNSKYRVYKKHHSGDEVLDVDGNIVGLQG